MRDKEYVSLVKMIECIDKVKEYTKGYNFDTFCDDDKTIDATVFAISQIGEMVKNVSEETMKKYDNIEWNMIRGLRNRIVHDYEGIILKNIWYVVENDLDSLEKNIQEILREEHVGK